MTELRLLYDDIEARTSTITAAHADWPCRKGCDDCCRSLAAIPELTVPELEHIEEGLRALPAEQQRLARERLHALTPQRPVVCPFLDCGICSIYEYRPAACRTYGFYVERDQGVYCTRIAEADNSAVVWGNQCGVDARLDAFGPRVNLREWFEGQAG